MRVWTKILYEAAMVHEMSMRGLQVERQVLIPVVYKGVTIGGKRLDLIVARQLIVELKSVGQLAPVHEAQVRTYLKITNLTLGLLINFNVALLRDGIKRIIHHP